MDNHIMKKLIFLLTLIPSLSFSVTLTNNIQGVGPQDSVKPYICFQNQQGTITQVLGPDKTGEITPEAYSDKVRGSIRFNGCSTNNTYLGFIEFTVNYNGNNAVHKYTPPSQDIHISYLNPTISSQGVIGGKINYTPIDSNFDLAPAHESAHWQFAGINLAGLEFGKVIDPFVIPNLSQSDSQSSSSDLKDTQTFINQGNNTVRLPISWGYLQLDGAGVGALNADYYDDYIRPLLQSLTHAKVYTIIDLHAYMRYSKFGQQYSGCSGEGPCPDGDLILDDKAYQSVWGQLWERIKQDNTIDVNYLLMDLVNEPVDVPDDKVFTIQASIIKMLRDKQFNGYILVEGNSWSGLHSWTTTEWTGRDGTSYTNATLFTRENFLQAGITDLSKILINVHQYLDSDYSGTHTDCLNDLTTTGSNGFNLTAFTNYLQENKLKAIVTEFGTGTNANSCSPALRQFMQYMQDNSSINKDYGFAGWTIWSTGHGWGNYHLRVKPDSYQSTILQEFLN